MRLHLAAILPLALLAQGCKGCSSTAAKHPDAGHPGAAATSGSAGSGSGSGGSSGGAGGTGAVGSSGSGSGSGGVSGSGGSGGPGTQIGPGLWSVDPDAGDEGVGEDPDSGYLVLNSSSVAGSFAWIASATYGFVSKIDTDSSSPTYMHEVARYFSVIPVDGRGQPNPDLPGLRPPVAGNGSLSSPSRTVIDLEKNMWVANRAPGYQGSVTKVANFVQDCVDRNHDGVIQTSRDLDGDGIISMDPAKGEFIDPNNCPGGTGDPACYDECVLFTQPLGPATGDVQGRALTVDALGHIWVGIWSEARVYKLDPADGHPLPVNAAGDPAVSVAVQFYGAVTDTQGRIWGGNGGTLEMIDPVTGALYGPTSSPACSSYGWAADSQGRVWAAGIGEEDCVTRFTPGPNPGLPDGGVDGVWDVFRFKPALDASGEVFGLARGIAVDNQGIVWTSGYLDVNTGSTVGRLISLYGDDGGVRAFSSGKHVVDYSDLATTSIGVGIDAENNVWVNNYDHGTDDANPLNAVYGNHGKAVTVNRNTGAVRATQSIADGLYTYSDFTGYAAAHFTAPHGAYHRVFHGCPAGVSQTIWGVLDWRALVPTGTTLEITVRAADTLAGLDDPAAETWGPYDQGPVDLQTAVGNHGSVGIPRVGYLGVTVNFETAVRGVTPSLESLSATWNCDLGGR